MMTSGRSQMTPAEYCRGLASALQKAKSIAIESGGADLAELVSPWYFTDEYLTTLDRMIGNAEAAAPLDCMNFAGLIQNKVGAGPFIVAASNWWSGPLVRSAAGDKQGIELVEELGGIGASL